MGVIEADEISLINVERGKVSGLIDDIDFQRPQVNID